MDSLQQQASSSPHQRMPLFPQNSAEGSLSDMIVENPILSRGWERQTAGLAEHSHCIAASEQHFCWNAHLHFSSPRLAASLTFPCPGRAGVQCAQQAGKGGSALSMGLPCWNLSRCCFHPAAPGELIPLSQQSFPSWLAAGSWAGTWGSKQILLFNDKHSFNGSS